MKFKTLASLLSVLASSGIAYAQDAENGTTPEEVLVFDSRVDDFQSVGVVRSIDSEELSLINLPNVEDALAYQPSLIVRKRYIGDINSTMGMRGSNMYQTTRSMVFADGLPLHYFLQTQFSGAPRWSLVSPSEIKSLDVVYGPFSAEYSGNAMGGVIEIETQRPKEQRINVLLSAYSQVSNAPRDNDRHPGYQGIFSYENRFDNVGVYFSLQHLESESQVLTVSGSEFIQDDGGETISGGRISRDNEGAPILYYGDQGPEKTVSDLAKLKFYFDSENFRNLLTFAYEDRERTQEDPRTYLRDDDGDFFWRGEANQDGLLFSVNPGEFYLRDQNRESLLVGFNSSGPLFSSEWKYDLNLSVFDILEDEDLESLGSFDDPEFDGAATLLDLGGSGWKTANVKLRRDAMLLGWPISVSAGVYFDEYHFESVSYASRFPSAEKISIRGKSGGTTKTSAVFVQSKWDLAERWQLGLGLRLEQWKSEDDFPLSEDAAVERDAERASPKLSLGYQISPAWEIEYAFAKAYRFPIVEELFQNERRTSGTILSTGNLQPEDGRHHNLLLEHTRGESVTSFTLFYESVRDVIFNQTQITPRVRTFLPVDEVETTGLEFSFQQDDIRGTPFSLSFNAAYLDTEVVKNTPNPATEGKRFPRMPKFRVNILGGYDINEDLTVAAGLRYQSNSFGSIDNSDREKEVFGAHDAFTFINLKLDYRVNDNIDVRLGVDNLTNDLAYVFSPWPGRTLFSEIALRF